MASGYRLAEADPAAVVGLEAGDVMALRCDSHRQHVVGKPCRLVPGGRERHMASDLVGVAQHLHPRKAVRVGPERVVDPGEVGVQVAPSGLQEVRQQDRHLMVAERVLARPLHLVPPALGLGMERGDGDELVPAVGVGATHGAHRPGQDCQQLQAAGHHPAALVARRRRPPGVRGEPSQAFADGAGNGTQAVLVDSTDPGCGFRRVLGVELQQRRSNVGEYQIEVRSRLGQEGLPVHPAFEERCVPGAVADQQAGNGQQQECLSARPGREPVVSFGCGVGQPGIDADDGRTVLLSLDDPLCVRVEVVASLQMR